MAREELKWHNIDTDDLPSAVKKSFSHARGQIPGYEPEGKTSWRRVYEHTTR